MDSVALTIAMVTYAGVALGGIPALPLTGQASPSSGNRDGRLRRAFNKGRRHVDRHAYNPPSLCLMVLSSQFRLGGFYTRLAVRITVYMQRPRRFLLAVMSVSAALSAVLMNDVVCLASPLCSQSLS